MMKKLIKLFRQACYRCHGMGLLELPSGDTKECHICNGKGML